MVSSFLFGLGFFLLCFLREPPFSRFPLLEHTFLLRRGVGF